MGIFWKLLGFGMGPVGILHTATGKVFVGIYALYYGLIELVAMAFLRLQCTPFPAQFPLGKCAST